MHTYIRTYIYTYVYTYIHAYVHTYVCTYIRIHIHIYIHTYVRTYVHTYVYTHIRTYVRTVKIDPYTGLEILLGLHEPEASRRFRQWAHEGGQGLSPEYGRLYPPGDTPGTHLRSSLSGLHGRKV